MSWKVRDLSGLWDFSGSLVPLWFHCLFDHFQHTVVGLNHAWLHLSNCCCGDKVNFARKKNFLLNDNRGYWVRDIIITQQYFVCYERDETRSILCDMPSSWCPFVVVAYLGHGVGEGCNNDIRGWSYSILHYCSIFCSSLHFLGTCLYYFTKLRFKNIVIVQALLQITVGTPINMEERRLHTNSCNISSLITYAILPMAQKRHLQCCQFFGRILQNRDCRRRWLLGKIYRCDIEKASTALNNQICWASDSRESNGLNLLKKMRFARKLYKAAHARVELRVEGSVLNSVNSLLLNNLPSCNCIFAQQPPQKCIYDTRKDARI